MATKVERLLKRARTQMDRGKQQKALGYYRDACKQAPFDPDIWLERARVAKTHGDGQEAVEAMFHAADLYARGGLAQEAAELAAQVLEIDPKHGGAKRFVRLLKRKDKAAEAETIAAEAAEAEAESAEPEKQARAGKKKKKKKSKKRKKDRATSTESAKSEQPTAEAETKAEPDAEAEAEAAPVIEMVAAYGEDEEEAAPEIGKEPEAEAPPAPEPEAEAEPEPEPEPEPEAEPEPDVAAEAAVRRTVSLVEEAAALPGQLVADGSTWSASGEHHIGRTTGELALGELSLSELVEAPEDGEFPLDDESELHVVQAVAATVTTSPLLSELDSDLVKYLIEVGSVRRCAAGLSIFEQGQTGTSLYLILEGSVAVERSTAGKVKRLAILRRGAFFGEMALLTDQPRSATVRAIPDVTLLEVSRSSIRKLVNREKRVLKLLMRFFRARLVGTMMATSPLFKHFGVKERRELVTRFRLREFRPEEVVVEKDVKSDGLYLVLVGRLRVFIPAENGTEQLLGELGPGDVFGEMSLLAGKLPSATVCTQTRAWLLRLPRDVFSELISAYPNMLELLVEISEERKQQNLATLTRVKPV